MPTQVPIEVFMIGRTEVDKSEVARWMKFIGADEFELPDDEAVTNPALLIALAGKRCYMSFQKSLNKNLNRIRQDYVDYFNNILASGHGSVLEHAVYNFAIENVSRVFTAEMNRHRAGWAISEGSLRFIRFGENIPYWCPDSIKGEDTLDQGRIEGLLSLVRGHAGQPGALSDSLIVADWNGTPSDRIAVKQQLSREVFKSAFTGQEEWYRVLETIWAEELAPESKFKNKKQVTSMMRRIIGLGVATGGVWSGNIRALRHVFTMRASEHAEEEMIHVFTRVVKVMADKEPALFGDFYMDDNGFYRPRYVKV
jgi:thymidylate synthase (FAD)